MASAQAAVDPPPPLLRVEEITKQFPGVLANDRVTLDVHAGEVHALLGENGAGKTTLVKVLYGIHQPDGGRIVLRGRPVRVRSPHDALTLGLGMVPQHFLLVRRHTVAENVCLGLAGTRALFPTAQVERRLTELGTRYGLAVNPRAPVWSLSISEQQRVEILKALLRGATILILDEPTSVLTPQEAQSLFAVLRRMKAEGHAVIFITHKLDEVRAVADRITVLRKGRVVDTLLASAADTRMLARMMVGRDVEFHLQRSPGIRGGEALRIDNLWALSQRGLDALRGVSLTVNRGEIVGVAGVAGNGQTELVDVVTGLRQAASGTVRVLDRDVTNANARTVLEAGAAHIPEERMRTGIVGSMSVAENLILRRYRYPPFSRGMLLDPAAIMTFVRRMITEYSIATPDPRLPARALSGGNVQRLILAREFSGDPWLIVAAHPTSGLDVSATEQIHSLLLNRRERSAGILLVSEDLDEILALSDRIAVMYEGRIVGIVPAAAANREQLGLMMTGQRP